MISKIKLAFLSWVYLTSVIVSFACDSAVPNKTSSSLDAETSPTSIIPIPLPRAVEIPSVIDPKDFASATDNNLGHWGVPYCATIDNPATTQAALNVVELGAPPIPSCPVRWPSDGEGLDYVVTTKALTTQSFSIDMRMSSLDKDAYITIESPPGQLIGYLSAYDPKTDTNSSQINAVPSSLLKTLSGQVVRSGEQTVRLIFHGSTVVEYLDFRREFPSPSTPVAWSRADLTNYTSFPDPLSEECIEYNGCTWAGWFAALDDQQTEGWVKAHNIIAIHSKHFAKYKLKTFRLRSGGREIDAKVYDMCADSDCDGCCTKNSKKTGFLIDIESYSLNRFPVEDGIIEWRCLDCDIPLSGTGASAVVP